MLLSQQICSSSISRTVLRVWVFWLASVIPGLEKGYLRKGGGRGKEKGMVERRLISRVSGETVFGFFCTYSRNHRQPTHYCECLTENQPHTQPPAGPTLVHKKGCAGKEKPHFTCSVCVRPLPLPLELASSIVTWVSGPSSSPRKKGEFIRSLLQLVSNCQRAGQSFQVTVLLSRSLAKRRQNAVFLGVCGKVGPELMTTRYPPIPPIWLLTICIMTLVDLRGSFPLIIFMMFFVLPHHWVSYFTESSLRSMVHLRHV